MATRPGVPSYSSSSSVSTKTTDDVGTESMDTTSSEIRSKSPSISLLSRPRSSTSSDLAQKRKVPTNPPKGLKKSKAQVANEPSSISISDRIKQFPSESLYNSMGKVFCSACSEPLS